MIQFTKLRLHGFKSFVERTEMEIGPGLTGIVGPNGCGKSNLVEALRWNMGESSTKRMRGGSRSMEDMIFNGTAQRPARNAAEVSIVLDNSAHTAPAPYAGLDDIEVTRKIARDHGSNYRINGKNVRARDVQLLYADILAGANSPYLVSQGKITNIIQARPAERRMILEEAAGITGLYARRHEAELRLRATDNNLKRLEDIIGGMENRLNDLKRQARQASRYRNLSAQIRQLEISIACLEWRSAFQSLKQVRDMFAAVEAQVAEHMVVVNQLTKTQTTQAKDLPDLRREDAELGAALQSQTLALQRLEDEQARLAGQISETQEQLAQIKTDRQHEKQSLEENTALLERLDAEEKRIRAQEGTEDEELATRAEKREALKAEVAKRDSHLTALMEACATQRARCDALTQDVMRNERRKTELEQRAASLAEQLAAARSEASDAHESERLRQEIEALEVQREKMAKAVAGHEKSVSAARDALEKAKEQAQQDEKETARLETEIAMLESVLESGDSLDFTPVFEAVTPEPGFETALSRALGDSLMGSLDGDAPIVWRRREMTGKIPALPAGAQALAPHVKAPDALEIALQMVGIVDDEKTGETLAGSLQPGQILVSRQGAYWRWDGLYIKADASDRNARHLAQKNQLSSLRDRLPKAQKQSEKSRSATEKQQHILQDVEKQAEDHQDAMRAVDESVRQKQTALNDAVERNAAHQTAIAKYEEGLSLAKSDLAATEIEIGNGNMALAAMANDDPDDKQEEIEQVRADLHAAREALQTQSSLLEVARQEQSRRKARLQAIGDERVNLQNRCIRARERLVDLDEREDSLQKRDRELAARPQEIKAEIEVWLGKVAATEKDKLSFSDRLAVIEAELDETTKALKQAEGVLGAAREKRASIQATADERQRQMESSRQYICEHFDMEPEALMQEAAMDPDKLPELDVLKAEREKAVQSRDMIGPVNLRAEQEAQELEASLGGILNERNDLMEAIDELRQGIQKLNREARERLNIAFDMVNGHFRDMFTRLFDGGKAHLALIESDDPLEAGLEIFAQPPGKALQSLSLLSGGEQTLTAIALIFAMFLTNPAPICVLDEVDAPLDDANVDRFCDMLEEFAERGQTRFIVITHHRLTMARMDRLYGVTMSERGVSQLVSVDLNQQLDFLDIAA